MTDERRTTLPNARQFPRFAGISTFCRFPRLDDVASTQLPVDWAVYGIPYDGGVTYRPGARFGPRAIRDASQYMKPVHPELGVDIASVFSLADAGDAPVRPYDCRETIEAAVEFATGLAQPAHTKLFAVGGDHSIAYANLRATWERRGRPAGGLAMLHFDAHLDTADVVWGEKWTHASPFIRAIEDGLVDPGRMLSVGIRGPLNTATDLDFGRDHGIDIVTFQDWREGDGVARITAFLDRLGRDEAYLTFDIDCLDPAFAPGTGTPCCGGFSTAEAFALLRGCAGVNLVGADVVEVLPALDPTGITALAAAHVILEVIAVAALVVSEPHPIILVVGPTAGGKTAVSIELAQRLPGGGECLCADSMQVYRGMDIGTAKPTADERATVPHHLFDLIDPSDESFSVERWVDHAETVIAEVRARGRWPIVVGGTNLYLQALVVGLEPGPAPDRALRSALELLDDEALRRRLEEVDPEAALRIHRRDRKRTIRAIEVHAITGRPIGELQGGWETGRPREDIFVLGLDHPVEAINRRINARVRDMMERGLLDEATRLHRSGRPGRQAREALGYKQLFRHLDGEATLGEAVEQIKIRTRRFAKQQRTWLRRFRLWRPSLWIEASDVSAQGIADQLLARMEGRPREP